MSLFTKKDAEFCKKVKESDWTPTAPVLEHFRESFEDGWPTTKELENHGDWKITRRLPTGVSKLDGSHIDDAERISVKYCGDKNFEDRVISDILPLEYQ
jgi:hypothetical protein